MRDLTKSYKKIDWLRWHKEKAFIRMFCAFACAILLIILLLMFPIVSDADEPKISDYYFIKDILKLSDALSHNGESGYYSVDANIFNEPTFLSNDSMNYFEQLQGVWDCDFPSGIGTNYNMTVYVSTNNEVKVIFAGQSIELNYDSNYSYLTPPSIYGDSPIVYKYENNSLIQIGYLDGGSYKNINDCNFILYTTMSINMYYQNASRNLNYLLIEGNVGKGSGGFDVTPNYPEESASNNLVLSQADYIFTHQNYYAPYSSEINTGSATPVGTITFKGQPNDYQLEHPEQFTVRLRFHFDYNVDYQNWNTVEFGYFKRTSQVLGNKKNLKIGFGEASYDVSMSTFIQNKNSVDLTIKDVFDNLMSNGNSLSGLLAQSKEVTTISYNDFLITCYANIVSGQEVSGAYIENYNFNSRRGLTTSKDIEDNKNPYTPNPSDQANDDPESTNITPKPNVPGPGGSDDDGGGSSSNTNTTNGNGSIVINNNPTFNNNSSPSASAVANSDGSGSIFSKLIDSLFGNGSIQEGSIGTPSQEKLITNTGASRFFQVASDSMSWVPASLWTELMMFLRICLGILVVAFILRIILDFL